MDARILVGEKPPGPPHARLHLVENQQQAVCVADRAQAPEERRQARPAPRLRLEFGSIMIAADCGPIAASTASRSPRGIWSKPCTLGPNPSRYFGLAAGGQGRQRAAVESTLERQNTETLGISIDRMALSRHLDRGLVGLRARIGEEDEIRERRVGEPPGEALAFGRLKQVGGMPELAPLVRQCLDQMGMRVPDGIHRDAGAEIEIALARRRRQPAAVAPLERHVRPHVSRHDRRWHDFGRHGSPPEMSAGALWGRAKTKTPPRGDGFLCQLI